MSCVAYGSVTCARTIINKFVCPYTISIELEYLKLRSDHSSAEEQSKKEVPNGEKREQDYSVGGLLQPIQPEKTSRLLH